jgi:predicted Zn-dependent protease with MMP-like domain
VSLETADLPDLADLTAEEPPLAPTILGLFRGAPIGEAPESEARAIVIYRKNLERAVASRDELVQQIRTTLLHELGHLRGEDDDALRARGLE